MPPALLGKRFAFLARGVPKLPRQCIRSIFIYDTTHTGTDNCILIFTRRHAYMFSSALKAFRPRPQLVEIPKLPYGLTENIECGGLTSRNFLGKCMVRMRAGMDQ